MLFTGEFVAAPTALDWGLVNRVVAGDHLMKAAHELADTLRSKPREILALGKALFYRQLEKDLRSAYADASHTITANMAGDIAREGVDAFFGKRSPRWKPFVQVTPLGAFRTSGVLDANGRDANLESIRPFGGGWNLNRKGLGIIVDV